MPDDPAPPQPARSRSPESRSASRPPGPPPRPLVWVCLEPLPAAVPVAVRLRRLLKHAGRLGLRCRAVFDEGRADEAQPRPKGVPRA